MFLHNIDPMHYLLRLVLRKFFTVKLEPEEMQFVKENINKHRLVLWINLAAIVFVLFGLRQVSSERISDLITTLLAPVMVMGTAWFGVSFGAVPAKLIQVSIEITTWMFTAFLLSLSTMIVALVFISPMILWPVIILIYVGAVVSCIQYDTADGLKAGLDDVLMKHSRAALLYYQREGVVPPEIAEIKK